MSLEKLEARDAAAATDVPIADMIACIRRELAMRERVYPRQVEANRMKQAEADQELRRMRGVLALLQTQPQGSLL